ncbi:MAG: hypothetical protein JWR39_1061 [Devosia sp.]|jgi:hypothetical protein|nr:hypothetical protein [Devosia sp.]
MLTRAAMVTRKSLFITTAESSAPSSEQSERQLALEYLAEAWNWAEDDGVESTSLAHASLFAALATLVKMHGDEAAAEMVAMLPDRIRAGEYNLERTVQ